MDRSLVLKALDLARPGQVASPALIHRSDRSSPFAR
jgi:hypothetical protein